MLCSCEDDTDGVDILHCESYGEEDPGRRFAKAAADRDVVGLGGKIKSSANNSSATFSSMEVSADEPGLGLFSRRPITAGVRNGRGRLIDQERGG
jgi:hypothetical protein